MRLLAPLWSAVVLWTGWSHRPVRLDRLAAPKPFWRHRLRSRLAGHALGWCQNFGDRRRRRSGDGLAGLAETVDLLALVAGAGMTVPDAVASVARRGRGPVAEALAGAAADMALGRRCADALDGLPDALGDEVRPLVAALLASERHGSPLAAGLQQLAAEVRADRRRRAEARARQVPVKLLFPLVCCALPAFALLTLAPLIAGTFRSLRL